MTLQEQVKKAIPMFILVFLTSVTMGSVYNIISPQLMTDFGIDSSTVSLLSMITMLMMGVASVAYSTLSDSISIRKLMLIGIVLLNIGTISSFIFSNINFYLLLVSVALMVLGGTCGSGLLIITVTRFLAEKDHAKYFGYNTACVSASQAMGTLLGGLFATYIGWRYLFLIPLISLFAIPTIKKYVPDEVGNKQGKLDIVGLLIFTLFTLIISLYFNLNNVSLLCIAFVLFIIFLIYISKAKNAFISIEFFKNKNYMILIALVILVFGLQTSFSFLFPFMAQGIYNLTLDKVSMIILPSFILAAIVGVNSGKLVENLGSFKTLIFALISTVTASLFTAFTADKGILWLGAAASLYAAAFALIYAPFMKLVIGTLEMDKIGAGIGLFNLMTGIGPSLMIVFTGNLMNNPSIAVDFGIVASNAALFSNILLIYAFILVISMIILWIKRKSYDK